MNDYNIDPVTGDLVRGSLETGDGFAVPTGNVGGRLGWIPSGVKMKLLGRNVRFALDWRAPWKPERSLARVYSAEWFHGNQPIIPSGWVVRRIEGRHAYEMGPWWYFIPDDARELRWRFYRLAIRVGAFELRDEGGYISDGRWFPSCPRFE